MTDLEKRAAACKHWRWMPGAREVRGERYEDGDGPWLTGHLPDLTDPATLGCLTALVAEAHGVTLDDVHVVMRTGAAWWVWVSRSDGLGRGRVLAAGQSEAEALVFALEAAP